MQARLVGSLGPDEGTPVTALVVDDGGVGMQDLFAGAESVDLEPAIADDVASSSKDAKRTSTGQIHGMISSILPTLDFDASTPGEFRKSLELASGLGCGVWATRMMKSHKC